MAGVVSRKGQTTVEEIVRVTQADDAMIETD
jgi:hypothetical protein